MTTHKHVEAKDEQTIAQITHFLKQVIGGVVGFDPAQVDPERHFLELGLDSLMLLQASQTIQEHMDVRVPFRIMLEEFNNVNKLAEHIFLELPADVMIQGIIEPETKPESTDTPQNGVHSISVPVAPMPTLPIGPIENGSTLEQIVNQQLQLMARQLDMLQSKKASGAAPPALNGHTLPTPAIPATPTASAPSTNGKAKKEDAWVAYKPIQRNDDSKELQRLQQKSLAELIERLTNKTPTSKAMTDRYRPYMADNRTSAGFRMMWKEIFYPLITERGKGARVWDLDDNEYVDISMGFGSLLFGHTPDFVIEAIHEQIDKGLQVGPQSNIAGEASQLLCELTGHERATFVNSGTEAVMTALRLARTVTGRDKIIMFAGSYHGTFDGTLVRGARQPDGTLRTLPMAPGIPQYMSDNVILLDFGDESGFDIIRAHAKEVGTVLVEPSQSRRPDIDPERFLHSLRTLTEELDMALIFDEVITGFRMHPAGCQGLYGIQADIATYGKAIGAGMPIGAIAGKQRFMDAIDGGVWQYGDRSYPKAETTFFAGTFFKHPLVMAVARRVLRFLQEQGGGLQERLAARAAYVVETLNNFFTAENIPMQMVHFKSLFRFTFAPEVKEPELFYYYLLANNVFVWEGRTCYISYAHTDEDIDFLLDAAKKAAVQMRDAGFFPQLAELVPSQAQLENTVPLTEGQKHLWILSQMGDDSLRAYNESMSMDIHGALDTAVLHQSLQTLVDRHEALRTVFAPDGSSQTFLPSYELPLNVVDMSALNGQAASSFADWLETEVATPFDLTNQPPIRATLHKFTNDTYKLVLTMHHIITDGWSNGVLLGELSQLYVSYKTGTGHKLRPATSFRDFVAWRQALSDKVSFESSKVFWLEKFHDDIPVLNLPTDRPRPKIQSFNGATRKVYLPEKFVTSLKKFSQANGCTLFITMLAGFKLLLHRLSGQDDVTVGIAASGQIAMGTNDLVGYCVNMLPLRDQISTTTPFTNYLQQVQSGLFDAYDHQAYPFGQLVTDLNPPRDPARPPIFSVVFNMDRPATHELKQFSDLQIDFKPNYTTSAKFDIFLNVVEENGALILEFEHNVDLFNDTTIDLWGGYLKTLLEQLMQDPSQSVKQVPLLSKAEQQTLTAKFNQTQFDYPHEHPITTLFEEQAKQRGRETAVSYDNKRLTYAELNTRANQLAHYLQQQGVKRGSFVGLSLTRSVDMVVSTLAILKAGAAYVPLDDEYPAERLAFMIKDTEMSLLITNEALAGKFAQFDIAQLIIDWEQSRINTQPDSNPINQCTSHDLAYVMYTSGSTGRPKGVIVPHRAVVRLVRNSNYISLDETDRIAQVSSISFDAATFELWGALLNGGQLVGFNKALILQPQQFGVALKENGITAMFLTAALFNQVARDCPDAFSQMKCLLTGGEAATPHWFKQVLDHNPPAALLNAYGPTENTTFSTFYKVTTVQEETHTLPIGYPIGNSTCFILDEFLQPVPVGVTGDLYVGGAGVSSGYLNRPTLTAERFVPNPFSQTLGDRLYKTGDLARYLPDGAIDFLGRNDFQVKVHGFRIELGEIETALYQQDIVQNAVVTVQDNGDGDKRLVSYLVLNEPTSEASANNSAGNFVQQWQRLYDETYQQDGTGDPTFNCVGWTSSYTNEPIPTSEMEKQVSTTVSRILALQPKRILEIGCGSGLLLYQLAPQVEKYVAIDFSSAIIEQLQAHLTGEESLSHVELHAANADDLQVLGEAKFDTLIINSVVQYFPSAAYLTDVLEKALTYVAPNGRIFIGDVRNYDLLNLFHTAVQSHQVADDTPASQLQQTIELNMRQEQELLLAPHYFTQLCQFLPRINHLEVSLKPGFHNNEMTHFRYDVTLFTDVAVPFSEIDWHDWQKEPLTAAAVRDRLTHNQQPYVAIANVPNGRLTSFNSLSRALANHSDDTSVSNLQAAMNDSEDALDPGQMWELAQDNYAVKVTWSPNRQDGAFDVLFIRRDEAETAPPLVEMPLTLVASAHQAVANTPVQNVSSLDVTRHLRQQLKQLLPDYMIPSAFVVLEALPINANGKVDRQALPLIPYERPLLNSTYVAPDNERQAQLAQIWSEVLRVGQVGIHDNFFELGGDSILAIQIAMTTREKGLKCTPKQIFQHQTIAELSAVVEPTQAIAPIQGLVTGSVPLTPIQSWFFEQLSSASTVFNQTCMVELHQPCEPTTLQAAWEAVLLHHDALRLRFAIDEIDVSAENSTEANLLFHVHSLAGQSVQEQQATIAAVTAEETPFDLQTGPLVRVDYFASDNTADQMLISVHHLAVDIPSWRILLEDVWTAYEQIAAAEPVSLPAKTTAFQQWAEQLVNYAQSEEAKQLAAHWLGDQQAVAPLPVDQSAGNNTVASSQTVTVTLDSALTKRIQTALPKAYRTQLYETVLAALALALSEWNQGKTQAIALEGLGREPLFDEVDLSRTVGWFTALYPAALHLPAAQDNVTALKSMKDQLRAIPHGGIPYGIGRYLCQDESVSGPLAQLPEAQVSFNYLGNMDRQPQGAENSRPLGGVFGLQQSAAGIRPYLLDLIAYVAGEQLHLVLHYSDNIHKTATIENLAQRMQAILTEFVEKAEGVNQTEFTPSDFPRAKLNQASLDALLNKLKK